MLQEFSLDQFLLLFVDVGNSDLVHVVLRVLNQVLFLRHVGQLVLPPQPHVLHSVSEPENLTMLYEFLESNSLRFHFLIFLLILLIEVLLNLLLLPLVVRRFAFDLSFSLLLDLLLQLCVLLNLEVLPQVVDVQITWDCGQFVPLGLEEVIQNVQVLLDIVVTLLV